MAPSEFEPRTMYLGELASQSHSLDRVMAVYMPAPNTYTGQDVVELSCHGSPVALNEILISCIAGGARAAGPGEFTRRAFLAGKMDLIQAEAVCDLIHAGSTRAAKQAADQLSGRLSREISSISDDIADARSLIEASIDFPEEDIEFIEKNGIREGLISIEKGLTGLSSSFRDGRLIREGVDVAIVGSPNVGKSSIFNALLGMDRAIVHREPGTTRDVVEADVSISGVVFHLKDTAGLRESECEVEGMGIGMTRREIENADIVIAVLDGSRPEAPDDSLPANIAQSSNVIFVINKTDLVRCLDESKIRDRGLHIIDVSAKTGAGMDVLRDALTGFVGTDGAGDEGAMIASARHKEALDEAATNICKARKSIEAGASCEFVAEHLREAQEAVGTITGEVTSDDILDRIFSQFCIGK